MRISWPGPSFTAKDEAAIDAVVQSAMDIANGSKDCAAYTQAYYAEDATVLPPNHTAIQGRTAIEEFLRSFPPMAEFKATKVHLEGEGSLAYVYGTYHMTLALAGGSTEDNGKYVEVWKRQADGSWRVAYDVFNSDLPATSAES